MQLLFTSNFIHGHFRKYQRQLLLANWLPKLPKFQKLQLETQNQIQRKLLLQKSIKIDICEETQIKGTPKVSKSEKVVEVSPSLEKKKPGYHSFMAKDGPRALGSKEILQVGFKVQDLIVNSPLLLQDVFL